MKLLCPKCGRKMDVRACDIREMDLNVEPWSNSDAWFTAAHLACPFCVIERGGTYWLQRIVRTVA